MEDLREAVRVAGWDAVLATVAAAHGLRPAADDAGDDAADDGGDEDPALAPWRDPAAAAHLGAVHESLLAERAADRVGSGSFYTPPLVVDWVLDRVLADLPDGATVVDPACGTGNFLVAAVRRLGPAAAGRVHGVDLDPVAVAIARLRLRLEAPAVDPRLLERTVRVGDGLGAHPDAPYDVVLGNPPFGGRLRPRAPVPTVAPAAYTDTSAVFLLRALDLAGPQGVVALVQPLSFLAARDAAPVRAAITARGAVTDFWTSPTPVFTGTPVLTCVPVVRLGVAPGEGLAPPHGAWGALAAPALGIPTVSPRTRGVLGDLGPCTADFRDQYYGLVAHVREGGDGTPLVTAGLVDPARCRWGETSTRFAKQDWAAPTVDLHSLHADGALSAWVRARLVPKVLVAPQGRVVEAVVDVEGAWLPSVPVVSLAVGPDRLWHALAVLLAPPVVAQAAATYAGTGLSARALKLSARQVAALPLPADRDAWDAGAVLARAAQEASDAERPDALRAVGEAMCAAYDDHAALDWWLQRVEKRAESRVRSAGRLPTFSQATTPRNLRGGD
ncbi:N-6 DNA methylase [Nocardioides plantarum]|uniref:site-specific DNA-methyltransferase (adenine-specific) n=1 Tax=Nocardioides plantarum TaxID=29299 RepID=A0ABV5KE83_9ACTN|nr:N-6 DNA methylase [Nocardioides plantarum]